MRTALARVGWRRAITAGLVAATVVVALLVGEPGRPATTTPDATPTADATSAAPANPATVEEFCAAFAQLTEAHGAALTDTTTETVTRLRDAAAATREVAGRTGEMPADAQQGIFFVADLFARLPDDATPTELQSSDHVPTFTEEAQADAFIAFLADRCPAP